MSQRLRCPNISSFPRVGSGRVGSAKACRVVSGRVGSSCMNYIKYITIVMYCISGIILILYLYYIILYYIKLYYIILYIILYDINIILCYIILYYMETHWVYYYVCPLMLDSNTLKTTGCIVCVDRSKNVLSSRCGP